jgi:hypothetical protein
MRALRYVRSDAPVMRRRSLCPFFVSLSLYSGATSLFVQPPVSFSEPFSNAR